ncbi:MAG: hypothetical protein RMH75_01970 [Archaeoglobaceae archaeon]|nr:hypothetical protein [Archaeoglobaceae archaeon]MDW7989423.1 hypothetical protein [Archaeoglobaceae archaeon]
MSHSYIRKLRKIYKKKKILDATNRTFLIIIDLLTLYTPHKEIATLIAPILLLLVLLGIYQAQKVLYQ